MSDAEWTQIDRLLELALREDVGSGDVTTATLVPNATRAHGVFSSREAGVLAGVEIVRRLFTRLDKQLDVRLIKTDGANFAAGDTLIAIAGAASSILTAERLALNILQRMSGVATLTRCYVDAIGGTNVAIMDTRKTIPGLRALDKLAVRLGGGCNHRHGLYDMILIKDNHLALDVADTPADAVRRAVERARAKSDLSIMVEVDTLTQLTAVLIAQPDFILLDNMPPTMLREAVAVVEKRCVADTLKRPLLEASGGITLDTIRAVAETGIDRISVGAITHSATALDIGLDLAWGDV